MRNNTQKPFWDVEENIGFVKVKSGIDLLDYKVYNVGTSEEKQQVADSLAKVRRDLNKLLFHLCRNPHLWINEKIAPGIFLTLSLHIPCIHEDVDMIISDTSNDELLSDIINNKCLKMNKLFKIQEMTPNEDGIIGLNKPKKTKFINIDKNHSLEIATKRSFHLTTRPFTLYNKKVTYAGPINNYEGTILPLALHEITHTTCNDNHWKDDNHQYPFEKYHSFLKNVFWSIKK